MLGAIKVGDGQPRVSLFRLLSRRWQPLAQVKPQGSSLRLARDSEDDAKPARAWIGAKPHPRFSPAAAPKINMKRSGSTWNPWLWTK